MDRTSNIIRLTTVADVVKAFDARAAMATWTGLSGPAISNWIARGWIPPDWYVAVVTELRRRGYDASPEIFRQIVKSDHNGQTTV